MTTTRKVFELKCTVCGTKTGEFTPPKWWKGDATKLTLADIGLSDVRCDEHPPAKAEESAPVTVEIENGL